MRNLGIQVKATICNTVARLTKPMTFIISKESLHIVPKQLILTHVFLDKMPDKQIQW